MKRQLCMFCGREIETDDLTMEHFAPRALWDKGRHPGGTRTLPAHKACNQAFSADNEYFRDVLLMEDGVQRHPEAKRVQAGALKRKFMERPGSIAKTLKGLRIRRIRTRSGIDLGTGPGFEVDRERIERVLRNVVKGVFYVSQKRPMPQQFVVEVYDAASVERRWLEETVGFMCPWQSFGDTVFCCRYVRSSKDPLQKFTCLMRFYEHRLFVGEAIDPELLGVDGELFVAARAKSPIVVPRWAAVR